MLLLCYQNIVCVDPQGKDLNNFNLFYPINICKNIHNEMWIMDIHKLFDPSISVFNDSQTHGRLTLIIILENLK